MTVRERKARLEGLKLCFIGDGNNMANSLIVGGLKCGMEVSVACPRATTLTPMCWTLPGARRTGSPWCAPLRRPRRTPTWWSPTCGPPWARRRRTPSGKAFRGLPGQRGADEADPSGCMVQHCLPAHRGEEITAEVFEAHADEIFEEAENRLHAQKAVLCLLMGGDAR